MPMDYKLIVQDLVAAGDDVISISFYISTFLLENFYSF